MTTERRFERDLPDLLAELAAGAPPDYRDDILQRVAATPQRPAWTFPERWLPMSVISRRPVVAPLNVPWRSLAVVALLAALLAVAVGIFVASRPRLPDPYGIAANGMLAYNEDGRILVKDSLAAPSRVLLGGADEYVAAQFTRRGDKLFTLRPTGGNRVDVVVTNAKGSSVEVVARDIRGFVDGKASPNGDLFAIGSTGTDETSEIAIYRTDGTGAPVRLAPDLLSAENPHWRPGASDELVFRGLERGRGFGFYLVRADGSNLRRLNLEGGGLMAGLHDFGAPAWSTDGSKLAFHNLYEVSGAADGNGFRLVLAELGRDGGVTSVRRLEFDPESDDESHPIWSPTGDSILFQRFEGTANQLHLGSLDGGAEPVPVPATSAGMYYEFSPDGQSVIVTLEAQEEVWAWDVGSGDVAQLDIRGFESWQRVLP